jgi:hypothetical protein
MSRSIFAVPDMGVARRIIDAAPAAGMFAKPCQTAKGDYVVIDHDQIYQDKAEDLVRTFVPSARRLGEPCLAP